MAVRQQLDDTSSQRAFNCNGYNGFLAAQFLNYVPANQYVYINAGASYWGGIPLSGSGSLGAGVSAKQNFRFSFWNATSPAQVLSPTVYTGGHQLNVNYAY